MVGPPNFHGLTWSKLTVSHVTSIRQYRHVHLSLISNARRWSALAYRCGSTHRFFHVLGGGLLGGTMVSTTPLRLDQSENHPSVRPGAMVMTDLPESRNGSFSLIVNAPWCERWPSHRMSTRKPPLIPEGIGDILPHSPTLCQVPIRTYDPNIIAL